MKGKLGRVIFRKIKGKVIPIRVNNVADTVTNSSEFNKKIHHRILNAKLPDGQQVAKMHLQMNRKTKKATILDVRVEKDFQKRGISKNLFKRTTDFLEKAGFKFLRGDDIQSAAQVKIRKGYGRYKAGSKSKNRSKFFGDQFGKFQEETRRISSQDAIDYIKQNHTPRGTGRQISATTMIKKRKK